jgi:hypothetical protein
MTAAPGWYLDPADFDFERYWTGSSWSEELRARTRRGATFPGQPSPLPPASRVVAPRPGNSPLPGSQPARFEANYRTLVFLSWLVLAGAIIGGAALIAHHGSSCAGSDDASLDSCAQLHPYAASGGVLMAVGILQAIAFAVLAMLYKHLGATPVEPRRDDE